MTWKGSRPYTGQTQISSTVLYMNRIFPQVGAFTWKEEDFPSGPLYFWSWWFSFFRCDYDCIGFSFLALFAFSLSDTYRFYLMLKFFRKKIVYTEKEVKNILLHRGMSSFKRIILVFLDQIGRQCRENMKEKADYLPL